MVEDNVVSLERERIKKMLQLTHELLDRIVNGQTLAIAIVEVHPNNAVSTSAILNDRFHHVLSGATQLVHNIAEQTDDELEDL